MTSNKKDTLKKLENVYCRIKTSSINGVGVFAIRDIPTGTDPFKGIKKTKWIEFNISELKHLGKETLEMIDGFYVVEKDGKVLINEGGLNEMNISFFLNNNPKSFNLKTTDGGNTFVTIRKIKKDEELSIAYSTYDYKYK